MKQKTTQKIHLKQRPAIIAWCLYDWANSSYAAVIGTFVFSAYFVQSIATDKISGTAQWGKTAALASILIAILSPLFGAIADHTGRRKIWLAIFSLISIVMTSFLWFAKPDSSYIYYTLTCVFFATTGFEIALVFYNAMLPDIAPRNYLGRISGWAWGLGYAGGLTCLISALFIFIDGKPRWLDNNTAEHIRIVSPFVAAWFFLFSIPLFIFTPDAKSTGTGIKQAVSLGLKQLWQTLKTVKQQKSIFYFLLARLFYIDGLTTIFIFGGIYATGTFGFSMKEVLEFGIAMNITAGIGSVGFSWLDDFFGAKPTILICLMGVTILAGLVFSTHSKFYFWVFALILGIFVGPIQAASRSLMARIIPKQKSTEMFGLYALSGKATAFLGPLLVSWITVEFHSQRIGMTSVLGFFIIGGLILWKVKVPRNS